jgi:hypothetical protein
MHNLIIESPATLSGYQDGAKNWWLRGCFGKANHFGANNRCYPRQVLEAAVEKYVRENVNTGAALAELDHPSSPTVKLQDAAIRVTKLYWHGNDLIGEALVLKNTPQGKTLIGILEGGGAVGVSTRATGDVNKDGYVTNCKIFAIDVVSNPANTGGEFVQAFYESEKSLFDEDFSFVDHMIEVTANEDTRRILKNMKAKRQKQNVIINPKYIDHDEDKRGTSSAAQTTHPAKRGHQGMKQEGQMRLSKGDRYVDPKDDSKDSSSNKNPFPSKHKPRHLKVGGGSKVKLEHTDYIKTAHLLDMAIRDPNRPEHEEAFHEAMTAVADYMKANGIPKKRKPEPTPQTLGQAYMKAQRDAFYKEEEDLFNGFRALGETWLAHNLERKRMNAMAECCAPYLAGQPQQRTTTLTELHNVNDKFGDPDNPKVDPRFRAILAEANQPMGRGYNVSQLTSTNPNGLDTGQPDNSKKRLTKPQLDDPNGVVPGWCDFFFNNGGGEPVDDTEEMSKLFNYLAKRLGNNTVD